MEKRGQGEKRRGGRRDNREQKRAEGQVGEDENRIEKKNRTESLGLGHQGS